MKILIEVLTVLLCVLATVILEMVNFIPIVGPMLGILTGLPLGYGLGYLKLHTSSKVIVLFSSIVISVLVLSHQFRYVQSGALIVGVIDGLFLLLFAFAFFKGEQRDSEEADRDNTTP